MRERKKKEFNCLFYGIQWETIEFRKRLKRANRIIHAYIKCIAHRDMVEQLHLDALNKRKIWAIRMFDLGNDNFVMCLYACVFFYGMNTGS